MKYPKIRASVSIYAVEEHEGQEIVYLHDQERYSDYVIGVPLETFAIVRLFDGEHAYTDIQDTCKVDEETIQQILETLDPLVQEPILLTDQEVQYLVEFLTALTSPSAVDLSANIPDRVPSGLPVRD